MGLIGTFGFLSGTQQVLLNITESGNEQFNASQESRDRTSQQRAEFEASEQRFAPFIAGLALSFFMYIGAIPITYVIKNTKVVGIILLVIGIIAVLITNGGGIIPFALLLPAGILALRYKKKGKVSTSSLREDEETE